ncbi:hypothetical protein EYF80_030170 [Liparis tanakae]|uniref:Uncharacterized protein n=1 Tax=Liparis tanakae TaxID=230148 RepID=A0A4Z2H173_9TELE|nr:hypothetical protein EYF80_030170 [Liparis tanakae]
MRLRYGRGQPPTVSTLDSAFASATVQQGRAHTAAPEGFQARRTILQPAGVKRLWSFGEGGNIGSHQRVVGGEWHRPARGGTCRPFFLMICPGCGEEGAAAEVAAASSGRHLAPGRGNWVARCGRAARLRREDVSIGWLRAFGGEQPTLTLRLPRVDPCLLKPR